MTIKFSNRVELIFFALLVFLSRLPFLFAGFGAEEDSWLLAITAKNIALSGQYEMSRAPAHPLQELIYAWLYHDGLSPFATNLLSAIGSVIAAGFFSLTLKQLGFKHYVLAGLAFAFAPVVYIASTYTIDYMLAMAFVMASFYFIVRKNHVTAGILLGLAIGFRITSGAMVIPFFILLYFLNGRKTLHAIVFSLAAIVVGLLTYIPVFSAYGFSFFTYSDQFPYPNLPKLIYKATIGVYGLIGVGAIIFFTFKIIAKRRICNTDALIVTYKTIVWICLLVCILYTISYLRLPQKSAYFIPTVPFIILLFGTFLSAGAFKIFCTLIILSSFFFSVNLTNLFRGARYSPLATKFTIASQEIFIDPLTGPIYSDYTKRLNKIAFTEKVFQKIQTQQTKTVLICGWWYNQLLVRCWHEKKNKNVELMFYISRDEMEKFLSEGYEIYYLPEQNIYNDLYSQMQFTNSLAKPFL